jgi:hypothetical protein
VSISRPGSISVNEAQMIRKRASSSAEVQRMPQNPGKLAPLNWQALVEEALRRRKAEKLTQREHAVLARRALASKLPGDSPGRFPKGWYRFDYALEGELREVGLPEPQKIIRAAEVRHTGWPMFVTLEREELAPREEGAWGALLDLASRDPVLTRHRDAIAAIVEDPSYQEQIGCREGQIWFCQTMREMTHEGGVYVAFGSEFRLLILNGVDPSVKTRLLHYGQPAIVVVDLPIDACFEGFAENIAKLLFALWTYCRLGLSEAELPSGFSSYIKSPVPAEHVAGIVQADRVYDQYNHERRWYTWEEIDLAPLKRGSAIGPSTPLLSI